MIILNQDYPTEIKACKESFNVLIGGEIFSCESAQLGDIVIVSLSLEKVCRGRLVAMADESGWYTIHLDHVKPIWWMQSKINDR